MILLSSFPKVGIHWTQFVIFNYFNKLNDEDAQPLTFSDLQLIRANETHIVHTHVPYSGKLVKGKAKGDYHKRQYDRAELVIYQFRNPYDTMISYWHYLKDREVPFMNLLHYFDHKVINKFMTLEGFTHYFLGKYIDHVRSTRKKARIFLEYEALRKDPVGFENVIKTICELYGKPFKEDIFQYALRVSSFEQTRERAIENEEENNFAIGYEGHFCRNGSVGQYKEEMSKELYNYIKKRWEKEI